MDTCEQDQMLPEVPKNLDSHNIQNPVGTHGKEKNKLVDTDLPHQTFSIS